MNTMILTLPLLLGVSLASPAAAVAGEADAPAGPAYAATVDPEAFRRTVPLEREKLGVTVNPADVRLIAPGVDKFSIYPLLGPPHFGEGITRRWNYVLFFPPSPGSSERMRCRMEIRFERLRGRYHVTVSEVVWQDQACADRVAAAG